MSYILGIDIGTSNTKGVAYTREGKVIAHSNSTYAVLSEEAGKHELDPETLFLAVIGVMKEAVSKAGGPPAGISFSSAMHGLIAVDIDCRPLTNMITWADQRSSKYADDLKNTQAGRRIYERTGTPVHAMSPLSKLIWLRHEFPEIFYSSHKFISIKEYIFFRFFGRYIIDHSVASATGLFDIYDLRWNTDALDAAGIQAAQLSEPVSTTHILRGISQAYAGLLGIDSETPVIAGASDGCLAHIGSNAVKPHDVSLTIGTSGAVRLMAARPLIDQKRRVFNYILQENLFISGGPVNNGGNVLQWFSTNFLRKPFTDPEDFENFIDEALEIPAGAEGIVFLPYIFGERAPVWDAGATAMFYGINGTHTVSHFMRAVMEGIAFGLLEILKTLEELSGEVNDVYVSGGFIKSRKWVALLADVLGRKLFVTNAEDSSAAGAAIIGMKALGIIGDLHDAGSFFTVRETFEPNMQNHETCRKNFGIYSQLYEQFKDIKK